ncbi:MAG: methyltransferase domain-containing protein [Planctomycetales bacterium]|nr:methyltransferase domain-containing protein [Planctomycetales bacterium]
MDLLTKAQPSPQLKKTVNATRIDLRHRCRLPELMDDPDLDSELHHAALRGLRRINVISRSSAAVWSHLKSASREVVGRRLRVLDVACGGGDLVVELAKRAARADLDIELHGCDISPRAVDYAHEYTQQNEISGSHFFVADAIKDPLPENYDVVMCSLFLHHLDEADAKRLLSHMAAACRHSVLVNDLRRTRLGYTFAVVGCRLLTRSPIVHTDGPLSVRAAWSDAEVRELAEDVGLGKARLTHHWPQRFLLTWKKQ